MMSYMMGEPFNGLGALSVVFAVAAGAAFGFAIAAAYNWALKLK